MNEEKPKYCECPYCDNASETGCMNEATELVEGVPLCPACGGSVAVVNKIRAIRARKLENAAKGIYHCAKCGKSLVTPDSVYMSGDPDEPETWRCPDCDKEEMAKRPTKAAEYSDSTPEGDDPATLRDEFHALGLTWKEPVKL